MLFQKYPHRYLHINDKTFYILGEAIADEAAIVLVMLPLKTLAAKIMPKGKATTSYAVLDSFQFLGQSMARILGIVATEGFGVRASKVTGCDFTQLPVLVAFGQMAMPTISIALAFLIVPRTIIKN